MVVPPALRCGLTNHASFYSFQAHDSSCITCENATIADLLDDLKADHDDYCGCGITVGCRVWLARWVPCNGGSTIGLDTSTFTPGDYSLPLNQFTDVVEAMPAVFHLLFEGVPPRAERINSAEPVSVTRNPFGAVFRIPGRDTCLASDDDQNYATTCKIPGMLLVDKSRFVSLSHCQFDQAWLPIIRRPTGFGKTMLLSMMENYVDIDSCHAPFPSADDALPAYLVSLPARGLLLVLHLDFGRLSLPASMSVPDLERACCAFLSSASAKCYGQYRRRLHDQGDHTVLDIIDFSGLLSLARMQDCRFFVGIDNYTAPLANGARHVLEPIIVSKILQPIFAAKAQGIVWRGFMLGDDLPGSRRFSPYCSSKLFNEQTLDLSWDPVASDILGIAEDEVVALGTALFGPGKDLLQQVRLHAEVPAEEMDLPSNDWRTYSVRDVLALARALQHSPNDTASYGGHIKSITSNDYLPPTRYLPESFSKGLEPYIDVEDCVDGAPSAQETTVPTSSVKFRAKPRKMHPVSEDGSRSDSDSYRTGSFASRGSESPPSSTFSGPASSTHSSPSAPMKGKKT